MLKELTIGAWVSTTADCPVRYQIDPNPDGVALILGSPRREFEIYLDPTTLAEIIRLGTQGSPGVQHRRGRTMTDTPQDFSTARPVSEVIELVIRHDPDGPLDIKVFIDGVPHTATEFIVDAGAGWTWAEWKEKRDADLTTASDAARSILLDWYNEPPGGEYVDGRNTEHWLDDAPLHSGP